MVNRQPPIGARPGSAIFPSVVGPPTVRVIDYDQNNIDDYVTDDLQKVLACRDRDTVTWIDVQELGHEAIVRFLTKHFEIHDLALEALVNVPQRPRLEVHDNNHVVIARMVNSWTPDELDIEQIGIVVGANYVITFQERQGDVFDPIRRRLHDARGRIRRSGPDYLTYALLDTVIDAFYPAMEDIGAYIDELEDVLGGHPARGIARQIHRLRRHLLALRRAVLPQREILRALARDEEVEVTEVVRVYLRDTYDRCAQVIDVLDSYWEMGGSLLDLYQAAVNNRMNEVMKMLTITATIFIPITFIAGVYGMNFQAMPELSSPLAYPVVLAVMAAVAFGMMFWFWRRGWLGGGDG